MKGKWLGFPVIFLLLAGAIFSFNNDSFIDDWLKDNTINVESSEINTLPIQQNERWLVLVVDFAGVNSNQDVQIGKATDMLIPHSQEYFSALSNNMVNLSVDVHQDMATATGTLADYGRDNGADRDSSPDGNHLPQNLAREVVLANKFTIDWENYDLNGDGFVDRLLILHTTVGQETGGNSNRIWSHFTIFEEPVDIHDSMTVGHYAMASLGSGNEGFGTAMHEMLHQMGAYDLYPSDGQQTSMWKGVGDWDIMASGNWNDNGKTPAIPMSSTLETIGLENFEQLTFGYIQGSDVCLDPTITFNQTLSDWIDYRIEIADGEFVWIEYRSDNIYENELPGTGVLVSYQDTTISGYDDNELNIDNRRPYLKIIEADGNGELLSGANEGQSSDLFTNGTLFGNRGIEIRTHDGILVDWYAEVIINQHVEILFTSSDCNDDFTIDMPDHAITTLPNEPILVTANSDSLCVIENNLQSTDGRLVYVNPSQLMRDEATVLEITFSSAAQHNSKTKLAGNLTCGGKVIDLETEVLSLPILPTEGTYKGKIPVSNKVEIDIPINTIGDGEHMFGYKVDGPLSRITESQQSVRLTGENDSIGLVINPNGLLSNNMIVNGQIEITDMNGNTWLIEVTLTAENAAASSLNDYINSGQMISLAFTFAALWVYLTLRETSTKDSEVVEQPVAIEERILPPRLVDAWGRELDD